MPSHTPWLMSLTLQTQYYSDFLHESFSALLPWEENQTQLFVGNIFMNCTGDNSVSQNCMQPPSSSEKGSDDPGKSSYHHAKYSQGQAPTPPGFNRLPKSPGLKQVANSGSVSNSLVSFPHLPVGCWVSTAHTQAQLALPLHYF